VNAISFFPENVWLVEVGGESLQVSLVRRFMGKQRVLKTTSAPDASALSQTLGRTSNLAFLILGREQGVVRQLQLPVDVQHDLKSALTLQIEAISSWPEQEVYWDYIAEKAENNPKILKITVVVIPKTVLDPWLQAFDAARIALGGASLVGFDVNVVPRRLRRGSARVQAVVSYILAACILIVGLAFLLREPYQQRGYASQIEGEIAKLEPQVKRLVKQEGEWKALTQRYQLLLRHLKARDSNLDALKTLSTVLPQDTFLVSYRYQNETVTISGISTSALDVQSALEKTPVFQGVQFSAPITRDSSGKDRFTMTMNIEVKP